MNATNIKTVDPTEAAELFDAVEQQALHVRKLREKMEVARERLKDCRTDYDEAATELERLSLIRQEKHPLLDAGEEEDE